MFAVSHFCDYFKKKVITQYAYDQDDVDLKVAAILRNTKITNPKDITIEELSPEKVARILNLYRSLR